jgi:hypothetical protein
VTASGGTGNYGVYNTAFNGAGVGEDQ